LISVLTTVPFLNGTEESTYDKLQDLKIQYDDDGLMKMKIKVSAKTGGRSTALAIAAGNISLKLSHISAIAFILLNNKVAMSTSTFESTSSEIPLRIVVSFANDPAASLGASLTNYDWVRFQVL
jgi:hypothetical protein